MWRTDPLQKTLMLGKIEGRRRRGQQMMGWLDDIPDLMNMNLRKRCELLMDREAWVLQSMGLQRVRHDWATELIQLVSRKFKSMFLLLYHCPIILTLIFHRLLSLLGCLYCCLFTWKLFCGSQIFHLLQKNIAGTNYIIKVLWGKQKW